MFANRLGIGSVHQLNGVLVARVGISLRSLRLSDAQSIPRFVEFQRQIGVQHHGVELVASGKVTPTFHEFVLRIYILTGPLGVRTDHIFKNDDVAGLPNGIVRFRGDDKSEGLQVGSCSQLASVVFANQHFSKIHWTPLG